MRILSFCGLLVAIGVLVIGCEWESSDDSGSWNDSMSWVNFSGVYRSEVANMPLVRDFTFTSDSSGGAGGGVTVTVESEPQDDVPFQATGFSGSLDGTPVVPDSVSFTVKEKDSGNFAGSFTDDDSGNLSGTVIYGDSYDVSGAIDYATGEWSVNVLPGPGDPGNPGAPEAFTITAAYRYSATTGGGDGEDDYAPNVGGWIYSMIVEQTGNRLAATDSQGNTYSGMLSSVAVPSGDSSGASSGSANAVFQLEATISGQSVKIAGSFRGDYTAPMTDTTGETGAGNLANRVIEGTWIEPDGQAQVFGVAADWRVDPQIVTGTSSTNTALTGL